MNLTQIRWSLKVRPSVKATSPIGKAMKIYTKVYLLEILEEACGKDGHIKRQPLIYLLENGFSKPCRSGCPLLQAFAFFVRAAFAADDPPGSQIFGHSLG